MNWVMALLAFAGLMAILSTIVSVVVEAVHKLFALRSRGLQEMLRAMHDTLDIDPATAQRTSLEAIRTRGHSKDASQFAKDMAMAPSWGGRMRWWWPARWGLTIFPRRFERLTKRQFAEQLAQTHVGANLADRPRSEISDAIARAGYEFDRYGVAQSHFFGRRAKLISGAVAFIFVIFANVNAINLYLHLAADEQSLESTMAYLGVEDTQELVARTNNLQKTLTTSLDKLSTTSTNVAISGADIDPTDVQTLREAQFEVSQILSQLQSSSDLPMGHAFFPFCGSPQLDPERCGAPASVTLTAADGTSTQMLTDITPLTLRGHTVPYSRPLARLLNNPGEAFLWIMSMIATAGLLALGAPFWFNLFNRTASLIGSSAMSRIGQTQAAKVVTPDPMKDGKRGEEEPDIEALTDAFLMASGRMPDGGDEGGVIPGEAPIGARLGDASRDVIGETQATTSAADIGVVAADGPASRTIATPSRTATPARPGMRRVRGDWSGSR